MKTLIEMAGGRSEVVEAVAAGLARVGDRIDRHIDSELLAVQDLVRHVETYRGKMLRPTMVLLSGMSTRPADQEAPFGEAHITVASVVEIIHLATLVHDDVLDEADLRRRGETINKLHGNEAAVILGDYLISKAFHLCSTLEDQRTALRIGQITNRVCEGELLQLHSREDYSLDERTYFEIVERKTGSLIGVCCETGARWSGASEEVCRRFERFGNRLGVAFQIRDDLLDLTGEESVVGKSLGKDMEKGKLTLPLIHHLATADGVSRGRSLELIEAFAGGQGPSAASAVEALRATGSIAYASETAERLVREARDELEGLPGGPAMAVLQSLAGAVVTRQQ